MRQQEPCMQMLLVAAAFMMFAGRMTAKPPAEFQRSDVASVMDRYERGRDEYQKRRRQVPSSERQKLRERLLPPVPEAAQIVEWCGKHPDDELAAKALRLVLEHSKFEPVAEQAVATLLKNHLDIQGDDFRQLVMVLHDAPPAVAEKCFATLTEKGENRHTRGTACWALGMYYAQALAWTQQLETPALAERVPSNLIRTLKQLDQELTLLRAEQWLNRARDEFGDLSMAIGPGRTVTLATMVDRDLERVAREFKTLVVGVEAPAITGPDMTGQQMTLKSYRGKVVVLSFWSTNCLPCLRMIPHERELTEKFRDQPFALLGVNLDREQSVAQKTIAKHNVTWPNWWDDPSENQIATAYSISVRPTIYVLDHNGIIRHKHLRGDDLDAAIESLLKDVPANP